MRRKKGKGHERAQIEVPRNGARYALFPVVTYSRPEVRKRAIGSVTRIGCRLKTQRATAIPNAAYAKCQIFIVRSLTPNLGERLRRSRR
jgi:hypothetical protein